MLLLWLNYHATPRTLAYIYEPIVPDLRGVPGEAEKAAAGIEKWLFNLGVTEKLTDVGFKEEDVEKLIELAMTTPSLDLLLSMAPIEATREVVRSIYMDSLKPIQ